VLVLKSIFFLYLEEEIFAFVASKTVFVVVCHMQDGEAFKGIFITVYFSPVSVSEPRGGLGHVYRVGQNM